jgi:hypothetical protein
MEEKTMVYKNAVVVVVKCNGKILRESDGCVEIPFGSEYTILIKNLESKRAVVDVEIDGETVTDPRVVIDANSSLELVGFKKGSEVKNRFKFIEKTKEISDYRGDKIEDGIIRVEVWFEKPIEYVTSTWTYSWPTQKEFWWGSGWQLTNDYILYSNRSESVGCSNSCHYCSSMISDSQQNKEGITVEGSDTSQKFTPTHVNTLEDKSTVITLKLCGKVLGNVKVEVPLTVDTKLTCKYCGRVSKSSAKFCSRCGARLLSR